MISYDFNSSIFDVSSFSLDDCDISFSFDKKIEKCRGKVPVFFTFKYIAFSENIAIGPKFNSGNGSRENLYRILRNYF